MTGRKPQDDVTLASEGGPLTATLFRYLKQDALIRDSLLRGVKSSLLLPGKEEQWAEKVRFEIETACIRSVDNFLSYISEILQLCIAKRPAMLKSAETITVEEAVRFSRHKDLISYLIDRTINRLSYRSFEDIEKYVRERTNIDLVETDEERSLLMTAIELRNIYSHNRGEASEATIKRLEQFDHPLSLQKGKKVEADLRLVQELLANLSSIARRADRSFASKFRLSRRRNDS